MQHGALLAWIFCPAVYCIHCALAGQQDAQGLPVPPMQAPRRWYEPACHDVGLPWPRCVLSRGPSVGFRVVHTAINRLRCWLS